MDEQYDKVEQSMVSSPQPENTQLDFQLLQLAVDKLPTGFSISDYRQRDCPLVFTNQAFTELTGYLASEVIGKNCRFLQGPGTDPAEVEKLRQALREGQSTTVTLQNVRKDGSLFWNKLQLMPVSTDGVEITHYVGFQIDVTEHLAAQKALRESENRFRKSFEAAPHGMAIVSAEGRFLDVNDNFCRMIGRAKEDILNRSVESYSHADEWPLYRALMTRVLSGQLPSIQLEKRYNHADGGWIWAALTSSLVRDDKGRPEYFVCHIVDLTIQKRLNEERQAHLERLQQHQRLESLGLLAGGIAHDFNNLLTSILGNIELSMMEVPAAGMVGQCLRDALSSAQAAADLCNQMLAYSGQGKFLVESLDLSALVWKTCDELSHKVPTSVATRFLLDERLPCIEGDLSQVRQLVVNLLTNSVESIQHRGGAITLTTSSQSLAEEAALELGLEPRTYVILEIEDTGSGMDSETRSKVFDPFFSTKFAGRGLGLAAVQGIATSHGGAVEMHSELGVGTTVKVYFPSLVTSQKDPIEPAIDERPPSRTVLIIDDDKRVLNVAERIFKKAGYRVLCAEDGRMGVHLLESRKSEISLVLLDMTMPHFSGQETFAAIHEICPNLPVLLSSGYTSGDVMGSFPADATPAGFLQKPYRPVELLEKVESLLIAD